MGHTGYLNKALWSKDKSLPFTCGPQGWGFLFEPQPTEEQEVLSSLLELKADVNARSNNGVNAMFMARSPQQAAVGEIFAWCFWFCFTITDQQLEYETFKFRN